MNRDAFEALAAAVCQLAPGLERVSFHVAAEASDFLRFNHARVRQATHVRQALGTVTVVAGARHAATTCALTGDAAADIATLRRERDLLAAELPLIPEDPYLLLPEQVRSTERDDTPPQPAPAEVIDAVTRHAADTDFVGFHASGPMVRAFADSRGQRNWHRVASFHFGWSLYHAGDLAVKSSLAGARWSENSFAEAMAQARAELDLLSRPRRTLAPGAYRACLSPAAMADLLHTLSWGGFGERGVRTGVSSLMPLHRGERQFHPAIQLTEATSRGLAPAFQFDGFARPQEVPLVAGGRAVGTLVSPRTAREYGGTSNAGPHETPDSLHLAPGTMPPADALRTLGTGVYLSDLHYLNYSDRQACRVTGMTRFACLWVEDGVPVAPIGVMRFDDSLLRMFGEGLVALGDTTRLFPVSATYGARQLRSIEAPSAVIEAFVFTL
jgi:predicted Zn-dependent protease